MVPAFGKSISSVASQVPREMFFSKGEAKWWFKQAALVNHVDAAWVRHIYKTTRPFYRHKVTDNAWYKPGDGDLAKNHAFVYRNLARCQS